jgi:hypothetical protein
MYTRSFYNDEMHPPLPDNYDGTAFTESGTEVSGEQTQNQDEKATTPTSSIPLLSGLFSGDMPLLGGLRMPTIGIEEILIIATAAFLLFSKNGDRECAILLFLLLLIN